MELLNVSRFILYKPENVKYAKNMLASYDVAENFDIRKLKDAPSCLILSRSSNFNNEVQVINKWQQAKKLKFNTEQNKLSFDIGRLKTHVNVS